MRKSIFEHLDFHSLAHTSLCVIAIQCAASFGFRMAAGATTRFGLVLALTAAAVVGSLVGMKASPLVKTHALGFAFGLVVLGVSAYTGAQVLANL